MNTASSYSIKQVDGELCRVRTGKGIVLTTSLPLEAVKCNISRVCISKKYGDFVMLSGFKHTVSHSGSSPSFVSLHV